MSKIYGNFGIIGELYAIFDMIGRVAPTNASVLIKGESGTGKGLVAKAIHQKSLRKDKPFVLVDCASIPEQLLESQLYGHVRGAFTGALYDKKGQFELANTGTIFLDEIGDISLTLQAKLLRVLQEGLYERVGDPKVQYTDVRVITSTNRNLEEMVDKGKFREDLFYRLNVVDINIPPLRDRSGDIPELTEHFIKMYLKKDFGIDLDVKICSNEADVKNENNIAYVVMPSGVRGTLANYNWPGNVRQLEHAIRRALIICDRSEVEKDNFYIFRLNIKNFSNLISINGSNAVLSHDFYKSILAFLVKNDQSEKDFVVGLSKAALSMTEGNKTKAASILRIDKRTLYNRLKRN